MFKSIFTCVSNPSSSPRRDRSTSPSRRGRSLSLHGRSSSPSRRDRSTSRSRHGHPLSSYLRARSSSDPSQYEKSLERSHRTPTPSSKSDDDEYEQQRNKDDEKKSEVRSKNTSNSSQAQTTSTVPPRTGGLYMPPVKLASSTDKSSLQYQRAQWDALEKNINLLVNQAKESNIHLIIDELFKQNIVRGCGLFARSIIRAQSTLPVRTSVYASLVSVINPWIEVIGEVIVKRVISSFFRQYQRNNKAECLLTTKFIAHLVNQNVLHEIIALQILVILLKNPSDGDVELAIEFVKECGQKLCQVNPRGLNSIFSKLKNLFDKSLNKRTRNMIEVLFAMRKDQFKENPAIPTGLNLVHENNQYTHMITLDACEPKPVLEIFKYDEKYEQHEEQYNVIREMFFSKSGDDKEQHDIIRGMLFYKSSDDESESNSSVSNDKGDEKEDNVDEEKKKQQTIIDETETNLVTLRRKICSAIQLNIGAEKCANQLLAMNLNPGEEKELCKVLVDICAQRRTYEELFGLLGQRICLSKKEYVKYFQEIFQDRYENIDKLEDFQSSNVAKFFGHLLVNTNMSWRVLGCIKLTNKTARVYINNLMIQIATLLDR